MASHSGSVPEDNASSGDLSRVWSQNSAAYHFGALQPKMQLKVFVANHFGALQKKMLHMAARVAFGRKTLWRTVLAHSSRKCYSEHLEQFWALATLSPATFGALQKKMLHFVA